MIVKANKEIKSSFLSCEKDAEAIVKKLFIENKQYGDMLKRLLVINTKDCLDMSNPRYNEIVQNTSLADLFDKGYFSLTPKVRMQEHEEVKAYIILSFDNFTPNITNPYYRDCNVHFDIICHTDYWDLGDYRTRPFKIMGIIDGILNNTRLSGIGTFQFTSASELVFDDTLSGYTLTFDAVHGNDDRLPGE